MNRQLQIAALALGALVLSGGGFVAGMTVASRPPAGDPSASPSPGAGALARRALGGAAGAAAGGGQVAGRVMSVGEGSITIETRQPGGTTGSAIALVGGSTRVVKTVETELALDEIKAGDQVVVIGQADAATGAITASAVLVGAGALQQVFGAPAGAPGGRPGGRTGATPSPSPTSR